MQHTIKIIATSFFLAAILTLSHGLLKSASTIPAFSQEWLCRVIISIILYGAVFIIYTFSLKFFEVSAIYPIYTAISIIGVYLLGVTYSNEIINAKKIIGMILLIISIALIA